MIWFYGLMIWLLVIVIIGAVGYKYIHRKPRRERITR